MNLVGKALGLTMPEDRFTRLIFHAVLRVWERNILFLTTDREEILRDQLRISCMPRTNFAQRFITGSNQLFYLC